MVLLACAVGFVFLAFVVKARRRPKQQSSPSQSRPKKRRKNKTAHKPIPNESKRIETRAVEEEEAEEAPRIFVDLDNGEQWRVVPTRRKTKKV